jgi:hypothetical protein
LPYHDFGVVLLSSHRSGSWEEMYQI